MRQSLTAENWAASKVETFPPRWKGRIYRKWESQVAKAELLPCVIGGRGEARRAAGVALCEITDKLAQVRLPLDATDSEICRRASQFANDVIDLARIHHDLKAVRRVMENFVRSCHIEPPDELMEFRGAMGRMTCSDWWRRGLRKFHAKAVEGAAINLGYVNRARDLYVSNESLERRRQQIRRNALMMESTVLQNEKEQEFTLAELAATGTANKAIRRGELMTRIAGFEQIAVESGHAGLFLTVTCPSRMHKWNSTGKGKKVFENQKYDGTTPKEAQAYLSKCYSRIRSALKRRGIGIYGFRIAEPHHDGTPHWHILIFHEKEKEQVLIDVFKRYLLADSPNEPGASTHRVKAEIIDWKRGSAAGYIAKYVAKNIDGLHVEKDLYGNPAMETSLRVEAWASTWGIRQFQQVGGAPVGVWRELRRVKCIPDNAPEHLRAAHDAVNKVAPGELGETFKTEGEPRRANWANYVKAQGGVFIGRNSRIKIAVEDVDRVGRYGDPIAAQPVGVETDAGEWYQDGIAERFRMVHWLVKSVRHVWQVVRRGFEAAEFSPPRTRVNNCTRKGGQSESDRDKEIIAADRKRTFGSRLEEIGADIGRTFNSDGWYIAGDFD